MIAANAADDTAAAFAELVSGPDEAIPLDRATLLIAACDHSVDVEGELAALDELAGAQAPAGPTGGLDEWHDRFFVELGFTGNTTDYDDPANSHVDAVVRRRLGIPITLAVVGMALAGRRGVHLVGIGMPGHFLLRHAGLPPAYIDPFDGSYLDESGCERRFRAIHGPNARFDPALLAPVGPRAILGRMLANLRRAYLLRHAWSSAASAIELHLAIPGISSDEASALRREAVGLRARLN